MNKSLPSVTVIGGGIFGASAAVELKRRNFEVSLFDPGPLPYPLASSTDISKAIRMDYGMDDLLMSLMEEAFSGWEKWNTGWEEELYHETGFLFLTTHEMAPGEFEFESYQRLVGRGYHPQRIPPSTLVDRFPAWNASLYPDGYLSPRAGWTESGRVVAALLRDAVAMGVHLFEGRRVMDIHETGSVVDGIILENDEIHHANYVIVAAGAWTAGMIPELGDRMWPVGQPVLHFQVENPATFQPPYFPPWAADISHTGWYGFPALDNGTIKIANHGPGWRLDPDGPRNLPANVETEFRRFLQGTFPDLARAPLIGSRMCFYCDTWDGYFWIDRHPEKSNLIVVSGGSGHGFKFAPRIGELVADLIEGRTNRYLEAFAWREKGKLTTEDARYH